MKLAKLQNGSKGRIRTRALSIASPAFYHYATTLHTMQLNADIVPKQCGWNQSICLASYVHSHADGSAYICHICSKSVQLFGIFPTFLNVWPQSPFKCTLGLEGLILFSLFPFLDESRYVCNVWSQSVQLFGSFPISMNWIRIRSHLFGHISDPGDLC